MKYLAFGAATAAGPPCDPRKRIRRAAFQERSSLPTSAACVVANGVRETLAGLIGGPVTLRLLEPVVPSPAAWTAIVTEATVYRVRGNVADAAIVWRAADACALAAAIFGESQESVARNLSPLECQVIERVTTSIASNLGAVCGTREGLGPERVAEIAGFVTYFELLLEAPVAARIGIALSREPSSEPRGSFDVSHLAGVGIAGKLVLDLGTMPATAVSGIRAGAVLPFASSVFGRCTLALHGRRVARGSGGISGNSYALAVEAVGEPT